LTPISSAAFDLQHLVQLEQFESWMRQIKGNRNVRHTFRREPLIAQIAIRPQGNTAGGKLAVELLNPRLQLAVLDLNTEIADAEREQLLILGCVPKRFWSRLHCVHSSGSNEPVRPVPDPSFLVGRARCRAFQANGGSIRRTSGWPTRRHVR